MTRISAAAHPKFVPNARGKNVGMLILTFAMREHNLYNSYLPLSLPSWTGEEQTTASHDLICRRMGCHRLWDDVQAFHVDVRRVSEI